MTGAGPTGHTGWMPLLRARVLASDRDGWAAPAWALADERVARPWWFVSSSAYGRAWAMVQSPASSAFAGCSSRTRPCSAYDDPGCSGHRQTAASPRRGAAARGTTADVYLVGGAAIALSFDAARTTRDLDAVFVPTTQVRGPAEAVAEANGLSVDWLNDAVKGFVPLGRTRISGSCSSRCICGCALRVRAPAGDEGCGGPGRAGPRRPGPAGGVMGLSSADEAIAVARACLGPGYPIPPRAQYLLEEIFEQQSRPRIVVEHTSSRGAWPRLPDPRNRPHTTPGSGCPDFEGSSE